MASKPPGSHRTGRSSSAPRERALQILCRVEAGAYADRLLDASRTQDGLSGLDRNLLQEMVQGTLTWRDAIDHLLGPYLSKPIRRQSPQLRNLLRLSVYQLRYLDRVPGYAAVSEAVDIAGRIGGSRASRFVNAVLRGISEDRRPARLPDPESEPAASMAIARSHPMWLIRRWGERYGWEGCAGLCDHNNRRQPITLRANRLRTSASDLADQLRREDVETERSRFLDGYLVVKSVGNLFQTRSHHDGLFSVQGVGAGLAVELLAPAPGEVILDVCAAPGGKASAAAERIGGKGGVVAMDLRPGRLRTLRESTRRLGLSNVWPVAADAACPPHSSRFQKVLVDAPCSSLGILSRHPELKWKRTEADIARLAALQLKLLDAASGYVAPGGLLVYSTCTTEVEENQGVVEAFLARRPEFCLASAGDVLENGVRGPFLDIRPHEDGVDGAFAARLRRT